MKRKSSSASDVTDNPERKVLESVKGISSSTSFDFGEFDQKLASIQIPKAEETIKGKSSSIPYAPEGKIPDFTYSEPKGVKSIKGKSSSTFFGFEGKISDFTFSKPKAEAMEGKSNFFEPKGVESIKGKSSASSGSSYHVVLDFDNRKDNLGGLILSERLPTCLKSYGIFVSRPDGDVLEVGVTEKVFIPVFSKGFASNESCLRNLVSMVDCRSFSVTNHIIPIFVGVTRSDVRLDTPIYRQGVDKLRGSYRDEVVNRWTEALIDVSTISGCFIPETLGLDEIDYLMNEVCQMALHNLRLSLLSKGTYLVGMNQHVESIIDMLNLGVNDVEVISILGREGVGKTTLARAIYDKLSSRFEGCSFIAGIEERHWNCDGIENLQAKLVSDLLNREVKVFQSVDEGRDLIRERFCHMKILIVLDDVWDPYYVEALVGELNRFGPGSRIIITMPTAEDRYFPLEHSIYDLSSHQLRSSDEEVFELFNHHASMKSYPLANFDTLPKELPKAITRRRGFCPLDIEIVGSLLYGKSKAAWEIMLLHLRQQDDRFFKDLHGLLRISYDILTETQKQIFLDVACLPDGMDRRIALLLWDDHSTCSQSCHDFEVLISLSLVKIDANNGIWMHSLIRSFGRDIIREDWQPARTGFVDVGSMRFFKMVHENTIDTDEVYKKRRFLIERSKFPESLEADYHAKCLKFLDLSWSKITEKWKIWGQIQAPQLRVLNLTGCVGLMATPNFSFCPDLEILILEHCSRLVEIDPSIQGLQRLATLNLRYCTELSVLPKEIGCLNALKELLMDGTSIQEIPVSIGHLKKLRVLTAINCSSLTQLPSSTCNLLFITALKLDCAKIAELPCSILERLKLHFLSLRNCQHITNLGPFVGEVERSLIELDVSGTSITKLPKSISKLRNLRVLKMEFCFLREFPPGFGLLKNLKEVHATRCKRLESLPHDIGGVKSLRILKVGHSQISFLPHSIRLLEYLEILDCTSCNKLQGLPGLPSSLTCLYVQSKEFKVLPDLRNLVKLKEFTLGNDAIIIQRISPSCSGVDPLEWLQWSVYMRNLALCIPHTKTLLSFPPFLRNLTLRCANLEHIPSFPSTLVVISIQNLRLLKELPSVRSLQNLREMEVMCCPKIKMIEGLERLKALEILTLKECGIEWLSELYSLRKMNLQDCKSLCKLPNVGRLRDLLEMKIIGCSRIKRIVGLGGLQNLEVLSISDCGIRSLDGLGELRSLRRLTITDCGSLRRVPDLSKLRKLSEKCVLLEDPE